MQQQSYQIVAVQSSELSGSGGGVVWAQGVFLEGFVAPRLQFTLVTVLGGFWFPELTRSFRCGREFRSIKKPLQLISQGCVSCLI